MQKDHHWSKKRGLLFNEQKSFSFTQSAKRRTQCPRTYSRQEAMD